MQFHQSITIPPNTDPNMNGPGDAPYLSPPAISAAPPSGIAGIVFPQLSLEGNLFGLAVNTIAAWWTWKQGGWWRVLSVTNSLSAYYFIGRIEKQL